MKRLLLLSVFALSGCAIQRITPMTASTPIKVNHLYARNAVKAYETYPSAVAGHRFALFHLKSGESFPMLCQETPKGLYPIPQTVMSNAAYNQWTVTAEPQVGESFTLLTFKLSQHDGAFFIGSKPATPDPKTLPLTNQPLVTPAAKHP